eukprot:jgi/Psemu1/16189/gm1.16189_g
MKSSLLTERIVLGRGAIGHSCCHTRYLDTVLVDERRLSTMTLVDITNSFVLICNEYGYKTTVLQEAHQFQLKLRLKQAKHMMAQARHVWLRQAYDSRKCTHQ